MTDGLGVPAMAPFPAPPAKVGGTAAGEVAELPSLEVETWQLFASGPAEWVGPMVGAVRAMGSKEGGIGTDDPARARGPKAGVLAPLALRGVRATGPLPIYR